MAEGGLHCAWGANAFCEMEGVDLGNDFVKMKQEEGYAMKAVAYAKTKQEEADFQSADLDAFANSYL